MALNYLNKVGAKTRLLQEDKRIAARKTYALKRSFLDRFRVNKIYEIAEICFKNGYLWPETPEETVVIDKLIEHIRGGNHAIIPRDIALIACYRPLYKTDIADVILQAASQVNNPEFQNLVTYAIKEPREEKALVSDIVTLGDISKDQTDDMPYPRWTYKGKNMHQAEAVSENPLNILIVNSVMSAFYAALEQPTSQIYALDSNIANLAYGMRIGKEQNVNNIKYIHGDFMNIQQLNIEFEYIHAAGVLSHLEEPLAGWNVLNSVLCDGGLMHIGLYSKRARKAVNAARSYLSDSGMSYSLDNLRAFRAHVKTLKSDDAMMPIALMPQFYSLWECRDLIFPPVEHQFDILEIKEALKTLNLNFVNFVKNDKRMDLFYEAFPSEEERADLNLWHEFEQRNPETFIGMYHFMCQKPAT